MSLHGLLSVTIGVPNVDETAAYYAEFGLAPETDGWFSTLDAGRQLRLVPAPTRRLIALRVGVDDADDLARAAANLTRLGVPADLREGSLEATEPVTGVRVGLDVAPRLVQAAVPPASYNGPAGSTGRAAGRQASPGPAGSAPASSGTPSSAAPATGPRCRSSPTGSASRSATGSRTWARSCAARPTTTTCSCWPRRSASCTTPPGRSTTSTTWAAAHAPCSRAGRAARLGPRPPLRGIELLLVPQGPGGQLLGVLLGHGLHRRRPAMDAGGPRGRARPVRLGPSAAALVPAPGRPGRHDDRSPLGPLSATRARRGLRSAG